MNSVEISYKDGLNTKNPDRGSQKRGHNMNSLSHIPARKSIRGSIPFITLFIIMLFSSSGSIGIRSIEAAEEPTEDRTVVLELFTETWCGPCKNADLATDELREGYTSDELLILEYHYDQSGDPFYTEETNARFNQYYSFNSWPSAMFNGNVEEVGSGEIKDVKERYDDHIQTGLSVKSHFFISIIESTYSQNNGYVRAYIAERSDSELRNLTVNTVIYRDQLEFDGGNGITDHRYVVREMFSEELEIPTDIVEYNFSLPNDSSYFHTGDNVGIVVFIQDEDTKEILQAETHVFFTEDPVVPKEENEKDESNLLTSNPAIPIGILTGTVMVVAIMILRTRGSEKRALAEIRKQEMMNHSKLLEEKRYSGLSGKKRHAQSKQGNNRMGHGNVGIQDEFSICPECGTRVKSKNLDTHRDKVHSISKNG